jgi:hypothetical protein
MYTNKHTVYIYMNFILLTRSCGCVHACESQQAMKREPDAWGCNWATLSLGTQRQRPGPPGWGLDAGLMTLPYRKIVTKTKEAKTRTNLTEFCKDG